MPTEAEVFDRALAQAFGSEGGLVDHPSDRGGLTKYGLSLRYLRNLGADKGGDLDLDGDVDAADVLAAQPANARRLFRRDFWEPSGAADLATRMPTVACETFDFAIVRGPANAVRAIQRALAHYGEVVSVDGGYGEATHSAILRFAGRSGSIAEPAMLSELRRQHAIQFAKIVERDRTQLVFLLGWVLRGLDADS